MVLKDWSTAENSRLVLKDLIASDTGERGLVEINNVYSPAGLDLEYSLDLKSVRKPITGKPTRFSTSSGVLIESSRYSIPKAMTAAIKRPAAAPNPAVLNGLGEIGFPGTVAGSVWITLGVLCALDNLKLSRLAIPLM